MKPPRRVTTVYDLFPDIERQRDPAAFPDIKDRLFWDVFHKCKAFTMLGVEGIYSIYRSIEYVASAAIPGDFVECGVFLGGAVLAMSEFAHHFGRRDSRIHLYDTFEGFPQGVTDTRMTGETVNLAPYQDCQDVVSAVLKKSVWPNDRFQVVRGRVEDTLRHTRPEAISLLRLDTDYYESTLAELTHLYPLLSPGGVLIVDDYGWMEGAKRATDEYLQRQRRRPMLFRITRAIRAGLKP